MRVGPVVPPPGRRGRQPAPELPRAPTSRRSRFQAGRDEAGRDAVDQRRGPRVRTRQRISAASIRARRCDAAADHVKRLPDSRAAAGGSRPAISTRGRHRSHCSRTAPQVQAWQVAKACRAQADGERRVVEQPEDVMAAALRGRRAARAGRGRRPSESPARRPRSSRRPAARSRTPRAPTSACCRCSGSGCRCRWRRRSAGDLVGRHAAGERDVPQAESARERIAGLASCEPPPTSVSVASGHRSCTMRNARMRARDVVERVEIARRHEARPERRRARGTGSARDRRCSG